MVNYNLDTLELTGRWEDLRDIKNLMGRYTNSLQLNRDLAIFDYYWSKEKDDISLGFNNGFYRGQKAVGDYYKACFERNVLLAHLLKVQLPDELSEEDEDDLYGLGQMRYLPPSSPVIELSEDGETAKGIWTVLGNTATVDADGPSSRWVWAYYCVDFIREGKEWKIWHMMYLEDIDHVCGQNWARPEIPLEHLSGFEELGEFPIPDFTEKVVLRKPYSGDRRFTKTPPMPVPYKTFSETFSYGQKEGAYNV